MLPEQFTEIKHKIEQSSMLTPDEKKEWLFLLPKMKPEQIKELDRILSIRMPVQKQNTEVRSENTEVKKSEHQKPKILDSVFGILHSKMPTPPKHVHVRTEEPSISSLSIDNMRSFPSVFTFLERVASDMKRLKAGGKRAEDIILAFEESPLYRAYLKAGLNLLDDAEKTESLISRQEFEAIAEFRNDLRKILGN